jgi:hypothetical protein
MQKVLIAVFSLLSLVAISANATPVNYSFTGNLNGDDDVQLFHFSVAQTSNVTLRTWSYAGGVNAAGDTIARGGFDPILGLFDSAGLRINQNDDGGYPLVAADSVTGKYWDTYLTSLLDAGSYTVAVMQYRNFAPLHLSDPFPGSNTTNYRDISGNVRNSSWAFDILNVETADVVSVPEPAVLSLFGLGLVGLGFMRRKQKQA